MFLPLEKRGLEGSNSFSITKFNKNSKGNKKDSHKVRQIQVMTDGKRDKTKAGSEKAQSRADQEP